MAPFDEEQALKFEKNIESNGFVPPVNNSCDNDNEDESMLLYTFPVDKEFCGVKLKVSFMTLQRFCTKKKKKMCKKKRKLKNLILSFVCEN